MSELKKAVIYVRVSSGKQLDGASLDTQVMRCQQWASNNKIIIDKVFREEGVSAKTMNRPALNEALDYLSKNKNSLQYLLTYQTDRLSRSTVDFYALMAILKKSGIEFKNVNSSANDNSANDELILRIEAVLAQHDNRLKSERVIENSKRHALAGNRMHKAPYGLRNTRDVLGNAILEIDPESAESLTRILSEYSTGQHTISSLLSLAQSLGLDGPSGKGLSFQTLSKILRRPIYAGLECSSYTEGLLIESKFEGLITPAQFYKNQVILKRNKNTAASYKQINPQFPLRRFARCAECDTPLRGSSPTGGSGKTYPKYHCTGCNSPSIASETMHDGFVEYLDLIGPEVGSSKLLKELIVRVWNDELKTLRSTEKQLHVKIDSLNERKQSAINKLIEGHITTDEKNEFTKSIQEKILDHKNSLEKISEITSLKENAIDYALEFMNNAAKLWSEGSIEAKIIYQKLIFPEGISYDLKKKEFGTEKISYLYRLASIQKDAEASSDSNLVISRRIELRLPG